MKVYVVLSGCVGDIGIVNIFKTLELANKWIEENKKSVYEPYVEEWNVFGRYKRVKQWEGRKE